MTEAAFMWMDPETFPGQLITPRSDPSVYETPVDLLFDTVEDAANWRNEQMDCAAEGEDANEFAYISRWVLCRRVLQVLPRQPLYTPKGES